MNNKSRIRWKNPINEKWSTGILIEKLPEIITATFLDVVCVLLFIYSSRLMFYELYGYGEMADGFMLKVSVCMFLISLAMEVVLYLNTIPALCVRLAVLLTTVLILIKSVWSEEALEAITTGLKGVAYIYISIWNKHYGVSLPLPDKDLTCITEGLDAVTVTVFVLLFYIVKLCRKNIISALIPLSVFVAELLIGDVPTIKAIAIMFAGILLSNGYTWKNSDFKTAKGKNDSFGLKQIGIWLCAALVLFVVYRQLIVSGESSAEEKVIKYAEPAEELLEESVDNTINAVVDGVSNWSIWDKLEVTDYLEEMFEDYVDSYIDDSVIGTDDSIRLNNEPLNFNGVSVFEIRMSEEPRGSIYLKGICVDNYIDGVWKSGRQAFEESCDAAGFSSETMSENIALLGINKLRKAYQIEDDNQRFPGMAFALHYYNNSERAHIPYFAEVRSEDVKVEGDSYFVRDKSLEKLSFVFWRYSSNYMIQIDRFDGVEPEAWEKWYEQYVADHYLSVPEGMTNVEETAEEISREILPNYYSIHDENDVRLSKAHFVAEWMKENMTYTKTPPELPEGTDPVEFFLGTSKTGYCEHYASASTLLLRKLGVPARYVTGFAVKKSELNYEYYGYKAVVEDSNAHAWVEIYLNGIGWVPVEVTGGYNSNVTNPIPLAPTLTPSLAPTPTPEATLTPIPTPTPETTLTPIPTPTPETTLTPIPTPTPGATLTPMPTPTPEITLKPITTPTPVFPSKPTATPRPDPTHGPMQIITGTITLTPTPIPTPIPTPTPTVTPVSEVSQTPSPTIGIPDKGTPSLTPTGTPGDRPADWTGIRESKGIMIKRERLVIAVIICIGLISVAFAVINELKSYSRSQAALINELKANKAIRVINRNLHRELMLKGKILKKSLNDNAYEEVLRKTYTDISSDEWSKFMVLVKAAAFSKTVFTDEDKEFCLNIYKRVTEKH